MIEWFLDSGAEYGVHICTTAAVSYYLWYQQHGGATAVPFPVTIAIFIC